MPTKTKNPFGTAKRFIVQRKRWLRNVPQGGESGLMMGRKMCCLGFYCRAVGKTPGEITDVGFPSDVDVELPVSCVKDFADEQSIANTNDDPSLSDKERETLLRKMFKALGITVKFVD